jgi:hypothetical protein
MIERAKIKASVERQVDVEATKQSEAIQKGTEKTLSQPLPGGAGKILLDEIKAESPQPAVVKPTSENYVLPANLSAVQGTPGAGAANPTVSATPPTPSVGTITQQSVWATPDACTTTGFIQGGSAVLHVHRSLIRPQEATDDFGYRLGKRFIVYQVTVENTSKDLQYDLSDIVIDLQPIYRIIGVPQLVVTDDNGSKVPNSDYALFQASSQDLTMLRGVPEKGQDYDPRNMTLHIFQGIGTVAAGVSGLTAFGDVMGPAMANFNGAFIQSFTGIAPDHTSTQLNRLSDMAFTSDTLIGKLQSKTFAVFIPESFLLDKQEAKDYWKSPRKLLNELPLDQLNICVDGVLLIQANATPDPTFSPNTPKVAPNTAIAITDSAAGATIYFTQHGETPTTNSDKYSTPIPVGPVGNSVQIEAFAVSANQAPSNVVVETFTAATQASPPTITCNGDGKTAKITRDSQDTSENDTIYYTTDGTAPSEQSKLASATSPVTVPITKPPLKIQAIEVGPNTSDSTTTTQTCGSAPAS